MDFHESPQDHSLICSCQVTLPFQTAREHLEENQFDTMLGQHMKTCQTESPSGENAFRVLLQQHMHCPYNTCI